MKRDEAVGPTVSVCAEPFCTIAYTAASTASTGRRAARHTAIECCGDPTVKKVDHMFRHFGTMTAWQTAQRAVKMFTQIARKLRTQYVESLCDNPVTLKSRLTVTQGHWKRNHWIDHTRLTIRLVIARWILSWSWNVGQSSLKVIEISAIRKLGCGFLFAFYSNYGRICSRFVRYSMSKNGVTLKTGLEFIQGH